MSDDDFLQRWHAAIPPRSPDNTDREMLIRCYAMLIDGGQCGLGGEPGYRELLEDLSKRLSLPSAIEIFHAQVKDFHKSRK